MEQEEINKRSKMIKDDNIKVTIMEHSDISKCPHYILMPDHYYNNTCDCYNKKSKTMYSYGYRWNNKKQIWDQKPTINRIDNNKEQIDQCLKYIDDEQDKKSFLEWLKDIKIFVSFKEYGSMKWDGYNDEKRNIYKYTFKKDNRSISIIFGSSIMDTYENKETTLYDILTCLSSDMSLYYNCRDFNDFCDELGYNYDSIKALRTYKDLTKQCEKFKSIIREDQLSIFPS